MMSSFSDSSWGGAIRPLPSSADVHRYILSATLLTFLDIAMFIIIFAYMRFSIYVFKQHHNLIAWHFSVVVCVTYLRTLPCLM